MVPGIAGKPATVQWLRNRFKSQNAPAVANLVRIGLGDAFIDTFLRPFVADPNPHTTGVIFPALLAQIEKKTAKTDFQVEYLCDGIEVQIVSAAPVFQRGLELRNLPTGNKSGIDPKWIRVDAKVAVRGDPAQTSLWEIGFTQTVMRLERKLAFRESKDTEVHLRSWIPSPHKDGPNGYNEVWFDPQCKQPLAAKRFQLVDVWIKDQPGMSWTLPAGHTLLNISGGEAFRTWLILRKTDGSALHFLRMWEWHVDYTIEPQNIARFGVCFDGIQLYAASGVGAVLDGSNVKDIIRTEWRKDRQLVTTFDEMKSWK
jgi:hypothetical protein